MRMQDDKETTRIEIFSDGAFAIIITLLVLEIKAPGHEVVSEKGLAYSVCRGLAWLSGLLYQLRHHPRHLGSSPLDVQPIRRGERPRYSGKADLWFTQVKWPLLAHRSLLSLAILSSNCEECDRRSNDRRRLPNDRTIAGFGVAEIAPPSRRRRASPCARFGTKASLLLPLTARRSRKRDRSSIGRGT